jgi:sulfane dehydrogenase subunit SoxC
MSDQMFDPRSSRRRFMALAGLGLAACQGGTDAPVADGGPRRLGGTISPYSERSKYETATRFMPAVKTPEEASSRTPLHEAQGAITPASLHFERHHSGIPDIDPADHELLVHGLIDRPTVFTMKDLKRLPSVSVTRFIECSGNGSTEWKLPGAPTAQLSHGLASCSEWTGVPLRLVLEELGVKPEARWIIAEGADACRMARSLPLEKVMDDALLAYAQNGEALRPAQGYPLRLLSPGWEGNVNVKWLHILKLTDQPYMTRDETSKYTDLMSDGKARQFTFAMEAKSLITSPSGGQTLDDFGFVEIRGLAWSGRGLIERVEVSIDGGETWVDAELEGPRHPKAFTRFKLPWNWDGSAATLLSRTTDETGYVQPSVDELTAVRGLQSNYHNNSQKLWTIGADGNVSNV